MPVNPPAPPPPITKRIGSTLSRYTVTTAYALGVLTGAIIVLISVAIR